MRNMLALCDKFANEYSVAFNAKKSKCLVAASSKQRVTFAESPNPKFSCWC